MADKGIVSQNPSNVSKISTNDILKSANWRELVAEHFPGADLQAWETLKKNFDSRQAQPPKKKSPKKSNSSRSTSRRRLASVVPFGPSAFERESERRARATGELVRRANERPDDQAESRSILLNLCGQFRILEVANV